MKNISVLIIFILLLSGCSSLPFDIPGIASQATPVPVTQPIPVESEVAAPAVEEGSPAEPTKLPQPQKDPVQTVTIFLDGQKAETPFALTSNLLSSSLATRVTDYDALNRLLGSPEEIGEFKVGSPSYAADTQLSSLEATVYMPDPSNLRFSLIVENGEWKIDEITILTESTDYPSTPEGVVLSFLTTYQEVPDRMSNYLTAERRSAQPPGGAAAMLQIKGSLEGMMIQSAAVNPDPPSAAIRVLVRAGGVDYPRNFLLSKVNSNWGIDAIEILEK